MKRNRLSRKPPGRGQGQRRGLSAQLARPWQGAARGNRALTVGTVNPSCAPCGPVFISSGRWPSPAMQTGWVLGCAMVSWATLCQVWLCPFSPRRRPPTLCSSDIMTAMAAASSPTQVRLLSTGSAPVCGCGWADWVSRHSLWAKVGRQGYGECQHRGNSLPCPFEIEHGLATGSSQNKVGARWKL